MLQRQATHAHTAEVGDLDTLELEEREKKREGRRSTFHEVCVRGLPDDAAQPPPYHSRNHTNIRFQSTSHNHPSLPRVCAAAQQACHAALCSPPSAAAAAERSLAPIHLSPVLTPLSSSRCTASPAVTANTQTFAQQPQRPRDVAGHQKARACELWHSKANVIFR